jgi:hypothetical protein
MTPHGIPAREGDHSFTFFNSVVPFSYFILTVVAGKNNNFARTKGTVKKNYRYGCSIIEIQYPKTVSVKSIYREGSCDSLCSYIGSTFGMA